jgi:GWxTD domain-containing protein
MYMSRVLVLLLIWVGYGGSPLYGAGQVVIPSEPFKVSVDYARFRGDAKSLYVELYYAFPQRSLTYRADSSVFDAGVDLTILIWRGDSLVYADRWIVPHQAADSMAATSRLELVAVSAVQLGEGKYTVAVTGKDVNEPARRDSVTREILIRMMDSTRVVLSDLELANSIKPSSGNSPFSKNTLEVIPSVQRIFSNDQACYYYAEMYNLQPSGGRGNLIVRTTVRDAVGREIVSREKQRRPLGESGVVADHLPVNNLRTGTYVLNVALLDSLRTLLSASERKFFVYNPLLGIDTTIISTAQSGLDHVYTAMDEGELDKEFAFTIYESTEAERALYKQLSGREPKIKFLSEFWNQRPIGFRDEYLAGIQHANLHYRVLGREGYKTDRGRVHVMYGPPDDIERHPNEPGTKPYEIWSYHSLQGGVIFAFVQRVSGGEYELVHSTHRNELRDDQWRSHYADPLR